MDGGHGRGEHTPKTALAFAPDDGVLTGLYFVLSACCRGTDLFIIDLSEPEHVGRADESQLQEKQREKQ